MNYAVERADLTLDININEQVKVKLTEYGFECHKREHYTTFGIFADENPATAYIEPEVDAEGYCKFQLHELMRIFGPRVQSYSIGTKVFDPFTIRFTLAKGR